MNTAAAHGSRQAPRIGILGGTFDPIHNGHVAAAVAARDAFDLSRILIMPSRIPPHRPMQPIASVFHRFAMTALAVSGLLHLAASDDELRAEGPSYTAETLTRLHARGVGALQIFFITGADAFAEIATWKRYPDVLDLANFVVVSRPRSSIDRLTSRLPDLAPRMRAAASAAPSTGDPSVFLLDAGTPDVSSTEVRARLAEGASIASLVPPLVETHIRQHGLYASGAAAIQLHGQD
ncbi:MAG: nicotinate-nucleotide adenylyltransferase [Vicinamibacterales bacterium]